MALNLDPSFTSLADFLDGRGCSPSCVAPRVPRVHQHFHVVLSNLLNALRGPPGLALLWSAQKVTSVPLTLLSVVWCLDSFFKAVWILDIGSLPHYLLSTQSRTPVH